MSATFNEWILKVLCFTKAVHNVRLYWYVAHCFFPSHSPTLKAYSLSSKGEEMYLNQLQFLFCGLACISTIHLCYNVLGHIVSIWELDVLHSVQSVLAAQALHSGYPVGLTAVIV